MLSTVNWDAPSKTSPGRPGLRETAELPHRHPTGPATQPLSGRGHPDGARHAAAVRAGRQTLRAPCPATFPHASYLSLLILSPRLNAEFSQDSQTGVAVQGPEMSFAHAESDLASSFVDGGPTSDPSESRRLCPPSAWSTLRRPLHDHGGPWE